MSEAGNRGIPTYKVKYLADRPIVQQIPDNYPEYDIFSLFLLGYSNRILFKSAVNINVGLELNQHLNTLHIRYILIIHFLSCYKKQNRSATQKEIERSDYPRRNPKILNICKQLNSCGLIICEAREVKGKLVNNYSVSDLGYKALNIMREIITETCLTQPSNSNVKNKRTEIVDCQFPFAQ